MCLNESLFNYNFTKIQEICPVANYRRTDSLNDKLYPFWNILRNRDISNNRRNYYNGRKHNSDTPTFYYPNGLQDIGTRTFNYTSHKQKTSDHSKSKSKETPGTKQFTQRELWSRSCGCGHCPLLIKSNKVASGVLEQSSWAVYYKPCKPQWFFGLHDQNSCKHVRSNRGGPSRGHVWPGMGGNSQPVASADVPNIQGKHAYKNFEHPF